MEFLLVDNWGEDRSERLYFITSRQDLHLIVYAAVVECLGYDLWMRIWDGDAMGTMHKHYIMGLCEILLAPFFVFSACCYCEIEYSWRPNLKNPWSLQEDVSI